MFSYITFMLSENVAPPGVETGRQGEETCERVSNAFGFERIPIFL